MKQVRERGQAVGLQFLGLLVLSAGIGVLYRWWGLVCFGVGLLAMGVSEERG